MGALNSVAPEVTVADEAGAEWCRGRAPTVNHQEGKRTGGTRWDLPEGVADS